MAKSVIGLQTTMKGFYQLVIAVFMLKCNNLLTSSLFEDHVPLTSIMQKNMRLSLNYFCLMIRHCIVKD